MSSRNCVWFGVVRQQEVGLHAKSRPERSNRLVIILPAPCSLPPLPAPCSLLPAPDNEITPTFAILALYLFINLNSRIVWFGTVCSFVSHFFGLINKQVG